MKKIPTWAIILITVAIIFGLFIIIPMIATIITYLFA